MRTRFIAAALVLISLWAFSAPMVLAATARQTVASRTHACCPGGHSAFGLPIYVSPAPAAMPCGGQRPCCAQQPPAKPAIVAVSQEQRPGLESLPILTSDEAPTDRTSITATSVGLSPSLFLHSAVLRI